MLFIFTFLHPFFRVQHVTPTFTQHILIECPLWANTALGTGDTTIAKQSVYRHRFYIYRGGEGRGGIYHTWYTQNLYNICDGNVFSLKIKKKIASCTKVDLSPKQVLHISLANLLKVILTACIHYVFVKNIIW